MNELLRHSRGAVAAGRCSSRIWAIGLLFTVANVGPAADETVSVKSGLSLRQELRRPINIYLRGVSVRAMVQRLASLHEVAILIDRRIDPDHVLDVQLSQVTLEEGLEQFAGQLGADAAVIGGTILIGPSEGLDRLRTDCVRQTDALRSLRETDSRERTDALVSGQTFRWDDLTSPREVLLTAAARFEVTVANPDLIPHDLWAGGVLADVNAAEAFALVAGQFDLTFSWSEDFSSIELAESPARLTVEETYRVRTNEHESAIEAAVLEFPLAEIRRAGRQLHVLATVGEHERIAALLSPDRQPPSTAAVDLGPLANRRFTLTIQRAPAVVVLRTLEAQGITIEYDADALQAAGIDLNQKISLSLDEAPAEEFFRVLCEPLQVTFEIDGTTVRLKPI